MALEYILSSGIEKSKLQISEKYGLNRNTLGSVLKGERICRAELETRYMDVLVCILEQRLEFAVRTLRDPRTSKVQHEMADRCRNEIVLLLARMMLVEHGKNTEIADF